MRNWDSVRPRTAQTGSDVAVAFSSPVSDRARGKLAAANQLALRHRVAMTFACNLTVGIWWQVVNGSA